uniref:Uncharacterized protein n=1 Tax=Glossina pallidipes TaxID=7398 RepID=A0A1B0A3M1_GLOPL
MLTFYSPESKEGEKKFLETSYESLIRKHKTAAISLNQQITEVREEVTKWKSRNVATTRLREAPASESNIKIRGCLMGCCDAVLFAPVGEPDALLCEFFGALELQRGELPTFQMLAALKSSEEKILLIKAVTNNRRKSVNISEPWQAQD